MMDYMNFGSTPTEEDCVQVGDPDYATKYWDECVRFMELLKKKFGPAPLGSRFRIKAFPHDFGVYHEVVLEFSDLDEEAIDYAYNIEANLPERWEE